MTVDFKVVPVAFEQGQDTRTQPKLVVPGKWRQLTNYSLSEDNTPKRRDGTTPLVSGVTGNGLATHGPEVLTVSGSAVSTYSQAVGVNKAINGHIGNCLISTSPVSSSGGFVDQLDCGTSGAVTLYAWRDWTGPQNSGTVNGINIALIDEVTGASLITNLPVAIADANANCPRVVYDNNGAFFVIWLTLSGGSGRFNCIVVTTAGVVGSPTTLVTDASIPQTAFDACAFFTSGFVHAMLVACRYLDGTSSLVKLLVARAGTTPVLAVGVTQLLPQATVTAAHIRGLCLGTYVGGNGVCFFTQDSGSPGLGGVLITPAFTNSTTVAQIAAFTQAAATCSVTATRFVDGTHADAQRVFSDQYPTSAGTAPIHAVSVDSTLTAFATSTIVASNAVINTTSGLNGPGGPFIAGRAFSYSGNTATMLPVAILDQTTFGTQQQNAYMVLDGVTGAVVGRAFYGSVWLSQQAPASTPLAGSSYRWPVAKISSAMSTGLPPSTTTFVSTVPAVIQMTPNTFIPQSRTEMGGITYFAGGQLTSYDGANVVEHGFPLYPENFTLAQSGGGSSSIGAHTVVFVYEWTDAAGNRHQSSLSPPVSITTTGSNGTITATVPNLLVTQKTNVFVVAYMTTVGGLTLYRYRPDANIQSSTAAATSTVVISVADAVLQTQEALYSQPLEPGAALPNDAPPPFKAICAWQNRIVGLSADNNLEYRFSQEVQPGFGLQFNGLYGDETLGGLVPSESGGTVAVVAMDEKLIVLCARKLYVVYGTGPDDTGTNSTLTEPQEIPSTVGCSDAFSVLAMPSGVVFKAQSGWHLLGRDLSVSYIGDGVTTYDGYVCNSAVLMQDRKECRFQVTSGAGGSVGVSLVFSYLFEPGQWSVFDYGGAEIAGRDAVWAAALNGYVWLASASGLQKDAPGVVLDSINGNPSTPTTVAQTAWLKVSGLEGYQRVRRLFLSATAVNGATPELDSVLELSVDFDDGSSPASYTIFVALGPAMSGVDFGASVDLRHKLHFQKCKSVSFTFSELEGTLAGAVLSGIQALALEIGVKKGVDKLPAGQTV